MGIDVEDGTQIVCTHLAKYGCKVEEGEVNGVKLKVVELKTQKGLTHKMLQGRIPKSRSDHITKLLEEMPTLGDTVAHLVGTLKLRLARKALIQIMLQTLTITSRPCKPCKHHPASTADATLLVVGAFTLASTCITSAVIVVIMPKR